jgi:hypothetical protein
MYIGVREHNIVATTTSDDLPSRQVMIAWLGVFVIRIRTQDGSFRVWCGAKTLRAWGPQPSHYRVRRWCCKNPGPGHVLNICMKAQATTLNSSTLNFLPSIELPETAETQLHVVQFQCLNFCPTCLPQVLYTSRICGNGSSSLHLQNGQLEVSANCCWQLSGKARFLST